eukprot:CAMPEP_0194028334 /NCGR_PEP_ID=MMETSP0009_2-20130614/2332_1 /TAXON_ID=210454 /ORGANISM="Grammatophora oceanica, Strain CCMP 410" /LENGTH=298 /DNA_ID=CAMNT_0038667691 /DNA_START=57 /DNA_END=950 /DNA_ORIENTATION=-
MTINSGPSSPFALTNNVVWILLVLLTVCQLLAMPSIQTSSSYSLHSTLVIIEEQDTIPQHEAGTTMTPSCEKRLDELDDTFNKKRNARKEAGLNWTRSDDGKHRFDKFEPEAVCISDERFGSEQRYDAFGDGPKFVCGVDLLAAQDECLVYSIGSHNQIDFEVAVKQHIGDHCEVHTFDPTLNGNFIGANYSTFHPWGLGEDGKVVARWRKKFSTMSFDTVIRRLGHENRTIDIIKIDCEGCEYQVMPPLLDAIANKNVTVNQIQIEVHIRSPEARDTLFESFDRAKMRIFHKERNQW